jgi:hypothetical protein
MGVDAHKAVKITIAINVVDFTRRNFLYSPMATVKFFEGFLCKKALEGALKQFQLFT